MRLKPFVYALAAALLTSSIFLIPFIPMSGFTRLDVTSTSSFTATLQELVSATIRVLSSQCAQIACPVIEKTTVTPQYGSILAIDISVQNPTPSRMTNLVVLFSFWDPYTCPNCAPDYTNTIIFTSIEPHKSASTHVEFHSNMFAYLIGATFRYSFSVQQFNYVTTTQWFSSATTTVTSQEIMPVTRFSALPQLVFSEPGSETVPEILGTITFLAVWLVGLRTGSGEAKPSRTGKARRTVQQAAEPSIHDVESTSHAVPPGLDPEFRKFRDRLQESLISLEIDEEEYVKRLRAFKRKSATKCDVD